jgi:hypothetical protein
MAGTLARKNETTTRRIQRWDREEAIGTRVLPNATVYPSMIVLRSPSFIVLALNIRKNAMRHEYAKKAAA